jgi:hypothetical protein
MDIIAKNKHRRNRQIFDNSMTKVIDKEFCPLELVTKDNKDDKQLVTKDNKYDKQLVTQDDKGKELVTEDDKVKELVTENDKGEEVFSISSCVII